MGQCWSFRGVVSRLCAPVTCAKTFFVENAAFFDTNSRHDPLIISVYHARKFFVVEYVFGDVSAYTGDNGINFFPLLEKEND